MPCSSRVDAERPQSLHSELATSLLSFEREDYSIEAAQIVALWMGCIFYGTRAHSSAFYEP